MDRMVVADAEDQVPCAGLGTALGRGGCMCGADG